MERRGGEMRQRRQEAEVKDRIRNRSIRGTEHVRCLGDEMKKKRRKR